MRALRLACGFVILGLASMIGRFAFIGESSGFTWLRVGWPHWACGLFAGLWLIDLGEVQGIGWDCGVPVLQGSWGGEVVVLDLWRRGKIE